MEEKLKDLKDLNFYFTDNMKQTLFDMIAIQKLLESDDLDYKQQKELEKEKNRLLDIFRTELQENNPVEVSIVRAFLQMKEDEKNKMEKLIEIIDPKEMEKFVKSSNYLLVDDGLDEYVIHESDLVDYIYKRNEEVTIYKPDGEFLLSTIGFFLNKISYNERQKIIERLIKLQLGEEESKVTYYCESTILDYM